MSRLIGPVVLAAGLLSAGFAPARGAGSASELHRAAEQGDRNLFQKILEAGADVNAYDERGFTPILSAVGSPEADADFIRFLLGKGADYRLTNRGKYSDKHHALSYAINRRDLAKVQVFLDAGADINYVRETGCDALIDAAYSAGGSPTGDKEAGRLTSLLEFLLNKGVALSGRTSKGQTALMILSEWIALDAVRQLLRAGADEAQLLWTPLHKAVAYGTAKDVAARLEKAGPLDPKDHAGRTPLVLAVQMGDIEKAELLWKRGADRQAKWRGSVSMLDFAISNGQTKLVKWLVANGADINGESQSVFTPLTNAVMKGSTATVKILLAAGADIHQKGKHGSGALSEALNLQMLRLLLDAGADTGSLSNEGRRVLMGLPAQPDMGLLTASSEDYSRAKHPREGRGNPEQATEPFWLGMIQSGVSAYQAKSKYADTASPVWSAQRFGQSLTFLPDGRVILIAGEHEDFYMSDFHIYNDAFVLQPGGKPTVLLYPKHDFPPTDGHSATLVGQSIYIIGNVGYEGSRREGFTPVYRFDTGTLKIEAVTTSGEGPGWIGRHRARLNGAQIEVAGGEIYAPRLGKDSFQKNNRVFHLDLPTMAWRLAH